MFSRSKSSFEVSLTSSDEETPAQQILPQPTLSDRFRRSSSSKFQFGMGSLGSVTEKVVLTEVGCDGKYECSECKSLVLRDGFLIEATDSEGNVCPEYDWQGGLVGRCYNCCRGWGPKGEIAVMFANYDYHLESSKLHKMFRKECKARHGKRTDVKRRDFKRLRESRFEDLMAAVEIGDPDMPRTRRYKKVLDLIKVAAEDVVNTFLLRSPTYGMMVRDILKNLKRRCLKGYLKKV